MQKSLVEKNAGIRTRPGTYIGNHATGEVSYTPPDGEQLIRDLLKNLEGYLDSADSLDPLIKLGVIHYQFEAIHPFYDGNGRTGRIVNVLYLILHSLLELPILYMSSYVIKHKSEYYNLLRKVTTEQAWEEWILYMLDAVEQTSYGTIEKVNKIKTLLETTIEIVRKKAPKDLFERVGRAALSSTLYENRFFGGKRYCCAEGCRIIPERTRKDQGPEKSQNW